jgi:putative ABC transport system substrate-binding protein
MMPELAGQRFVLLREIVPNLRRVAVLWRPGTLSQATIEKVQRDIETSANASGAPVQLVSADGAEGLDAAFSTIKAGGSEGLIVLVNPIFFGQRKHIIDRAAEAQLPSIYEWKGFAQSGGLISYGAVVSDVYRRAASYVDKILRGAKPGDLPVEGAKKTELVVNLKTARALGLTVPPSILALADEVIG